MTPKQTKKDDQTTTGQEVHNPAPLAVRQGGDSYKVGPGCPPKEYQFQPGESGNPDGPPKHRTNLWVWFAKYMNMTDPQIAKLDTAKLTQAQQAALRLVEKVKAGEMVGSTTMARYIADREEGRTPEHLILDKSTELSDEECKQLRNQMREVMKHGDDTAPKC